MPSRHFKCSTQIGRVRRLATSGGGLRPFAGPVHLLYVMERTNGFFAAVDEVLVGRARRGDPKALETIYRLFDQAVFTLARRICPSPSMAEDVTQETFLQAYRSLPDFRGDGAFGAWLRRITVSKACLLYTSDAADDLQPV